MFALAVIALLAYVAGRLARLLGQPPVIGEIALGILLGPTLLSGAISDAVFPADIRPYLTALANIGVALFMFTVGAEVEGEPLRGRRLVAGAVAGGSIALPFGLGVALAAFLFQEHPTDNRAGFVFFMGAAMSVTAFPVLARILVDRGMNRTWLGNVALACAAIDDVLAWSLLAVVVAIAGAATGSQLLLLLFAPYLLVMFGVIRPALRRLFRHPRIVGSQQPALLVLTLSGLFASAAFTEWIGLHFLFGAFLFGAVMPRRVAGDAGGEADHTGGITQKISHLNGLLLLPIFFIVAGLRVDLSGLGAKGALELALILAVAVGGKFFGAYAAARLTGIGTRPATALAVLMNTRGLTELIILTVGLELGVLDGELYSSMVVMALVTTAMAGPLLQLLYPIRRVEGDDDAESAAVPQRVVSG
jgi:Kef-type K+ transport system membrane component KefB